MRIILIMNHKNHHLKVFGTFLTLGLLAFLFVPQINQAAEEGDPPEVELGQRLFRETRFAQFFFAHALATNSPLSTADVSIANLPKGKSSFANPYKNSINCASCHLVDEVVDSEGMRSYSDFAFRSPVPFRKEDPHPRTLRNAPTIVGAVGSGKFLHFDGEFTTAEDLVVAGWTGRNFGWLPQERSTAIKHLAKVLREDDGSFSEDKNPYADIFSGRSNFQLPREWTADISKMSDEDLVLYAAKFVRAYMESLTFEKTSAFDRFLALNELPSEPAAGESPGAFHARLLLLLDRNDLKFPAREKLKFHSHDSTFGKKELAGFKIFLNPKKGNCVACHHMPEFTDFSFHNTGVAQTEFDLLHGMGAFLNAKLPLVSAEPDRSDLEKMDLGVFGVLANPNLGKSHALFQKLLCPKIKNCNNESLASLALGRFKTPSLRDLGQSEPYLHNGSAASLTDAVKSYMVSSALAKRGLLRNGAEELQEISLNGTDVEPLVEFLKSLDEDYH